VPLVNTAIASTTLAGKGSGAGAAATVAANIAIAATRSADVFILNLNVSLVRSYLLMKERSCIVRSLDGIAYLTVDSEVFSLLNSSGLVGSLE
jgi:hypothetical protein